MDRGIALVGLNHRTAPVELRERVAFANGRFEPALQRLVELPGVAEGVIVSTCNRVEVVACGTDHIAIDRVLPGFLASTHDVREGDLAAHLYHHEGRDAVRHLFRVAASLDSMIVGEPHILGQMKEQYRLAAALGASGRVLHRCFHRSFAVAKRVRNETGVAARAVSVGSAAVELAGRVFDGFADKTALLVGAGTMGELVARQLLARGTGTLLVANRTYDRAIVVARALGGVPVPWDRLGKHLPLADLVIGAAGGEQPLVGCTAIEDALRERRRRSMLLIDLAVPRCFEAGINALDGAYLYDIDDLDTVVSDNRDARSTEAHRAEAIVDAEVESFWRWLEGLRVVPTIVAMRERSEAMRVREIERHRGALAGLDAAQREAVEALTRTIVAKVLHGPTATLRRHRGVAQDAFLVDAARVLFRLTADGEPEDDEDGDD